MDTKELICVVCPLGCRLTVSGNGEVCAVTGNQCERGQKYAVSEMSNPLRTVTSTVKIQGTPARRLPVKTSRAFPKGKMFELMGLLRDITVCPPVKRGQVIVENALNTGIDVVSAKTIC